MKRLDINPSGLAITETRQRDNTSLFSLQHDTFDDTLTITLGSTPLILNTDYTINEVVEIEELSSITVYTKVAIINAFYHNKDLTFNYITYGDFVVADNTANNWNYLTSSSSVSLGAGANEVELTQAMGKHVTLSNTTGGDVTVTGLGNSCPVGWEVKLLLTSTSSRYIQMIHATSGAGLNHTMIRQDADGTAYYGYRAIGEPSVTTLYEQLTYVHEGNGRWRLVDVPKDKSYSADGQTVSKKWNGMMTIQRPRHGATEAFYFETSFIETPVVTYSINSKSGIQAPRNFVYTGGTYFMVGCVIMYESPPDVNAIQVNFNAKGRYKPLV